VVVAAAVARGAVAGDRGKTVDINRMPAPQQQFVFDSRLPVSPSTRDDDPNHPRNVMRNAIIVANQATADTRYDIQPPPRIEGFKVPEALDSIMTYVSILGVIFAIGALIYIRHTVLRVAFIALAIVSIHYAVGRLEKRTV
jgi:hypothetical protein